MFGHIFYDDAAGGFRLCPFLLPLSLVLDSGQISLERIDDELQLFEGEDGEVWFFDCYPLDIMRVG